MDIVLDRYGNPVEVMSYYCHADIWVATLLPQDIPMACISINVDTGERFEWEEDNGLELLDRLDSCVIGESRAVELGIKGKDFKIMRYYADFLPLIKFPEKQIISCVALKPDGELVCQWVHPDYRGSVTKYAYSFCFLSHVLENVYLANGITKIYGLVHKDNIVSNKYHVSQGSTFVESINVNGEVFNKYEQSISDIMERAKNYGKLRFNQISDMATSGAKK